MTTQIEISKFMELQYLSLREEIKENKSRKFKMLLSALLFFPTMHTVLLKYQKASILMMIIPFFVIAFVMLYVKQLNSIMRCGSYIRFYIENKINENNCAFIGWEKWLEEQGAFHRKTVDSLSKFCIFILFLIYYIFSICLASFYIYKLKFVKGKIYIIISNFWFLCFFFYIIIGVVFCFFIFESYRVSTERRLKNIPTNFKRRKDDSYVYLTVLSGMINAASINCLYAGRASVLFFLGGSP